MAALGGVDIDIQIPLVVDLDGTLTITDSLHESFTKLLFENPLGALAALTRIWRAVAVEIGLFESVAGSDGACNLEGKRKADHLGRALPRWVRSAR